MKLNTQEIVVGFVMIGVGIGSVSLAISYDDPMAREYPTLTTTFVPILWGGLLAALSGIFVLGKFVQRRTERDQAQKAEGESRKTESSSGPEATAENNVPARKGSAKADEVPPRRIWVAVVGTIAMLVVYVLALRKLNFVVITTLLAFGLFTLYANSKKWWINALLALGSGLVIHIVFVELMNIPL